MLIKEVCKSGSKHTMVFEILDNEYVLECVVSRKKTSLKIINSTKGVEVRGYGVRMAEDALKRCSSKDGFLSAQSFMLYILYILKGFNLGFKIRPSEVDKDILLKFIEEIVGHPVNMEYHLELFNEPVSDVDIASVQYNSGRKCKYTILGIIELILSKDLGILAFDNRAGKWYKSALDDSIETYIIFQYSLGEEEVSQKELLSAIGMFIRAYTDYTR